MSFSDNLKSIEELNIDNNSSNDKSGKLFYLSLSDFLNYRIKNGKFFSEKVIIYFIFLLIFIDIMIFIKLIIEILILLVIKIN
jgi:hypothetical protein